MMSWCIFTGKTALHCAVEAHNPPQVDSSEITELLIKHRARVHKGVSFLFINLILIYYNITLQIHFKNRRSETLEE